MSAKTAGLGNGFTIPCNIPGHVNGPVSLAVRRGLTLPRDALLGTAHLICICAFECVQLFAERTWPPRGPRVQLPQRELDCIAWVIRGKTDSEIGQILGVTSPGRSIQAIGSMAGMPSVPPSDGSFAQHGPRSPVAIARSRGVRDRHIEPIGLVYVDRAIYIEA